MSSIHLYLLRQRLTYNNYQSKNSKNTPSFCSKADYAKKYEEYFWNRKNSANKKIEKLNTEDYKNFLEAMNMIKRGEDKNARFNLFSSQLQNNMGFKDIGVKSKISRKNCLI